MPPKYIQSGKMSNAANIFSDALKPPNSRNIIRYICVYLYIYIRMYIYNCKDITYKYTVIAPFYFHHGIPANKQFIYFQSQLLPLWSQKQRLWLSFPNGTALSRFQLSHCRTMAAISHDSELGIGGGNFNMFFLIPILGGSFQFVSG